jgi:ABC-2 type transport system ATP-binding protein
VFSTHILSDLERVAMDVAFLKDGRIALQGGLDELLESARRVIGPSTAFDGMRLDGEVRRHRQEGGTTTVITRGGLGGAALAARDPAVRVEALSLEDLFIEVTQ